MSKRKIEVFALPYVKQGGTYIDVGANIGETSVPFRDIFDEVHVFEPNPRCLSRLSHKKFKNRNNFYVHPFALSDRSGKTDLVVPAGRDSHGTISALRIEKFAGVPTETYTVDVRTLDSFGIQDVSFIKIDVEQGEEQVVKGAEITIRQYRPVVMFENKRKENDALFRFFEKLDYTIIRNSFDDTLAVPNPEDEEQ